MTPKLFDIHTHVNFSDFDSDRAEVIQRALDAGVWMVVVGSNLEDSKRAVEIASQYSEGVYASVGIHPTEKEIDSPFGDSISKLEELAKDPKVVAVGECGLDFSRNPEARSTKPEIRNKQIELFKKQIELAQGLKKPLMIHCNQAHDDLAGILEANKSLLRSSPGVMHFFGGEGAWEKKDEYLKMGFYLSFSGVVTFPKYSHADGIKQTPLDRILAETDAPFVAPVPFRGQRNEPFYVQETARKIAEIRGESYEKVCEAITQNVKDLFSL